MRTTAAVLDVERELAVEQHLEAAPGARRSRRRPRRGRERRLRRGAGDAVAAEPLPFLERDHGEPRLLSCLAVDRLGGQEREIGEPLLERAHGRRRIGRRAGRRRAGRRHVRPRCVPKRDRPRGDVAGEEPERGAALDEQADRLHTRDGGRRSARAASRGPRGSPPSSRWRTARRGRRSRPRSRPRRRGAPFPAGTALAISRLRSAAVGPASSAVTAWRSVEPLRFDVDDLFALEERDLHRRRLRARAAWREDERDRGERCRHPEPSEEIPHPAEPIVR